MSRQVFDDVNNKGALPVQNEHPIDLVHLVAMAQTAISSIEQTRPPYRHRHDGDQVPTVNIPYMKQQSGRT